MINDNALHLPRLTTMLTDSAMPLHTELRPFSQPFFRDATATPSSSISTARRLT